MTNQYRFESCPVPQIFKIMTIQDLYQWFLTYLLPYKDNDDYGKRWIAFTALADMFIVNRKDYLHLISVCSCIINKRFNDPYLWDWINENKLELPYEIQTINTI